MSAAGRAFRPIRSAAFAAWPALAACLACSGGGGTDVARGGDLLTGGEDLGRIEGRVSIGPLCPVESFPPDPSCRPTPETFAAVKVLILDAAGAVLRQVDLDGEGRYSVELDPGVYLVDTTWRGPGEGDGDPIPGDSGSIGGGSGIGEPGDDGSVGSGQDDPPPVVIDSSGTGVVPDDPGVTDPGDPGDPGVPPGPGDPPDPGFPPDPGPPDDPGSPPPPCDPFCEPPPPCDPIWPTDPGGADGVTPAGGAPTVVDSTGCGGPGFPGEPPEPFPGDSVFPDSSFPGDTASPPPFPLPFPNDSLAEGPPDGEAVPQHLLPVEVVLEPGETQRLDIDIDTGIR